MILLSVYDPSAMRQLGGVAPIQYLFNLLAEREGADAINISHTKMPSYARHASFVTSKPYQAWYLIVEEIGDRQTPVGAIYLTKQDEIGIHLFKAWQGYGYGPKAIKFLRNTHVRPHYLANINPANTRSIEMFKRLGFQLKQVTYALEAD